MGKVISLLLIVIFAFASEVGYLFLAKKITAGERRIYEGQRQLDEGEPQLKEGRSRLEAGRIESFEGKKDYKQAEGNPVLVLADKLLYGGEDFDDARKRIAEGDRQISEGEGRIKAGEGRIDAGKLELGIGREYLRVAKIALVTCMFSAIFFASLSVVLGFCWRKSLVQACKGTQGPGAI